LSHGGNAGYATPICLNPKPGHAGGSSKKLKVVATDISRQSRRRETFHFEVPKIKKHDGNATMVMPLYGSSDLHKSYSKLESNCPLHVYRTDW
jgi:hypothetical protein